VLSQPGNTKGKLTGQMHWLFAGMPGYSFGGVAENKSSYKHWMTCY
jgi:hypothetical protein